MADIVLTKADDGKLRGLTDADERRWSKFRCKVAGMGIGDTVKASFKLPRSPGFHKRHFSVLKALFDCQEQFDDREKFREWTQVGAGFCDLYPGPHGRPVAISRSIAWDALEEADFAEHHRAVIAFARSHHFSRFLWPHLSDVEADTLVNAILQEFDA
jgi:hypothetical protein